MIAGRTGGTCAFRAGVFKPVATACAIAIGLLVLLEGAARVTEIWIPDPRLRKIPLAGSCWLHLG